MVDYESIRKSMDEFICPDMSPAIYSVAIAGRMFLPQDGTPWAEARPLLQQCFDFYAELAWQGCPVDPILDHLRKALYVPQG